jgi:surface polysaccharide O-acyltransferase-like enzyme
VGVNKYLLLAGAVVTAVVAPMLWGVGGEVPVIGRLLDILWGNRPSPVEAVGNFVSFPFFPWFAFVLVGMFFGEWLAQSEEPRRTFRRAAAAGLAVFAVGLIIITIHGDRQTLDYYHGGPWVIAWISGFVFVALYLCEVAIRTIPANPVFATLFYWSRNVNSIYMIQWIVIMWVADFASAINAASYGTTIVLMAAMVIASHGINVLYLRLRPQVAPPVRDTVQR